MNGRHAMKMQSLCGLAAALVLTACVSQQQLAAQHQAEIASYADAKAQEFAQTWDAGVQRNLAEAIARCQRQPDVGRGSGPNRISSKEECVRDRKAFWAAQIHKDKDVATVRDGYVNAINQGEREGAAAAAAADAYCRSSAYVGFPLTTSNRYASAYYQGCMAAQP
jgi:hypothetical protein